MILIQESFPSNYGALTQIFVSSTDKTYVTRRLKRVNFYALDFKKTIKLIDNLLETNKKKKFMLKEEKKFLQFAQKLFSNNRSYVKAEDFVELLGRSFVAVVARLIQVQKELIHSIKEKHLDVDCLDNEYLFTIQNLLDQVRTLHEDVKNFKWDNQNQLLSLSRKSHLVLRNLNEVIMSISIEQFEDIKPLSDTVLESLKVEFSTTNKIFA